jgi:hypothetical protein
LEVYIVNYSFAKTGVQSWIDRTVQNGKALDEWGAFALFAARPQLPEQILAFSAKWIVLSSGVIFHTLASLWKVTR